MQKIDIRKIIDLSGHTTSELGRLLFPHTKDPYRALSRIKRGEAFLDTEQLSTLADFLRVPVGMLFEGDTWKMGSKQLGVTEFKNYDYVAFYNHATHSSTIYKGTELLYTEVEHKEGLSLPDYINLVTELILKYKNQNEHD